MFLRSLLLALAAAVAVPGAARAAESYDGCTGFIDSLPATISTQGTWCLRRDLATGITSGQAITVAADNVTIDCNDYKLGNLVAGKGTATVGIHTQAKVRATVRHCNIRGFLFGILLDTPGASARHRIEDNILDGATQVGIELRGGNGSVVRGNIISSVGGSTLVPGYYAGIYTSGNLDILDNTVTRVWGGSTSSGIHAGSNNGGSVSGNRVRDILAGYGFPANGIEALGTRQSVRDNDVASTHGGGIGLVCADATNRARRNVVGGFAQGLVGCGDAGGNDVTP